VDPALIDEAYQTFELGDPELIVQGGQKLVAKGTTPRGLVVMKLVAIEGAHAHTALERARREVALLGRVHHERVVKLASELAELGEPVAALAWLEDFIEGDDIRVLMGLPWVETDVLHLALDTSEALSAIHAEQCVHRDLSASNVRKGVDGRYTVLDPGLARHLAEMPLTGSFQPGTPGYLSPEHVTTVRVAKPVPASDVFCLGILLYQAATGDLPIPVSADVDGYHERLRNSQAPSVLLARPDLPSGLAAVVDRCLSRHAARRYLNGARLHAALMDL
jgi:serine/threonine-protein kinase